MATVAADPYGVALAGEYDAFFDILQQTTVALLVVTLDGGDSAEAGGNGSETFLFGFTGHTVIHIGPLVVLSFGGFAEILHRVAYFSAMEELIPQFGVFLLVVGGLFKKSGNLLVAILAGFGSEISVFIAGHRLAGKRILKVTFGFCSFKIFHVSHYV